jgi:hypothetical protein
MIIMMIRKNHLPKKKKFKKIFKLKKYLNLNHKRNLHFLKSLKEKNRLQKIIIFSAIYSNDYQ